MDSPDFVKNADLMWKQSVWSSCISASLAAKHLKPGGVILLPGAKPAMKGTPGDYVCHEQGRTALDSVLLDFVHRHDRLWHG